MLRWMMAFALLGGVAILSTGRWQVGGAFVVGSAIGMLNFYWLWQTGKVLMDVQTGRVPGRTAFLMGARYPLVLAGLTLLYFSGWLPILPVIAGLLVPGGGVLVESLIMIGASLGHRQTV